MIEPVRTRRTFAAVRAHGIRVRHRTLSASYLPGTDGEPTSVAYAIPKRVGGAVERNRLRRRLRAIVADLAANGDGSVPVGVVVIGAGPEARVRGSKELRDDVVRLFEAIASRSEGAR